MPEASDPEIQRLCRGLRIDAEFFVECVRESVVEIREIDGRVDLGGGSALRLRRLERLCEALDVELPVALLLLELTRRVDELEEKLHGAEGTGRKWRG
jgi:hypothetical protein